MRLSYRRPAWRRRMSLLSPRDQSLAGRLWWAMAYVGTPVVAVLMLTIGASSIGNAWAAAHGRGQLGTLHVERKDCSNRYHVCTGVYGAFQSDDGSVQLSQALLDLAPAGLAPGDDVRVRFLGERHPPIVYTASGSREWMLIAALTLAAIVALVVWGLSVRARLSGRLMPWMMDRRRRVVSRDIRAPDKTGHTHPSVRRKRALRKRRRSIG